ncbi:MAG: glycosyltransferase family 39 protein, partial [Anaerolineales bacterium]
MRLTQKRRKRWIAASLAAMMLIAAGFLRARNLDQFKLTDETKWAFRSANFSLALHRGEYAETFQRSHPGVSTMWAGWLGMQIDMPDYDQNATRYVENTSYKTDLRQNDAEVMQILVPARQVVIALSMLVLAICYFYLERLFGVAPALLGTLLLAFEPFFVGHTRILHVDGFLSVFMYLSIIAYLGFLKNKRKANLVVSGIAAGLTWLTKTPGFYLAAGVVIIAVVFLIQEVAAKRDEGILKILFETGWPLAIWAIVGVGTFIILWPAMWVQPVSIIKSLVFESIDYAVGGHTSPVVFNGVVYRDG